MGNHSMKGALFIKRSREFFSLNATRTRALRINFLWNTVGSAAFALSQWGVLIVFAKLGSATLVGQLVYGLAIASPLFVVAGLQLRSVQATDAENRHTVHQYFGLRALTTLAATIVAALIAGIMWSIGSQVATIILLWVTSKAIDSGSDAIYGLFQQSERMDYVGVSLTLRGVLAVTTVAVLFRESHSAPLALLGLAGGWGAVFILFDIPMARNLLRYREGFAPSSEMIADTIRSAFGPRQLLPLFWEATPLGIVALLLALQIQIPRYVVAGVLHNRELGLFSAAAYLTFIGTTMVNSLGAPACVRLAKYHVAGACSAFCQLMTKLLLVAVTLGIAGIIVSACAGKQILTLLYTKEYSGVADVLVILCVSGALSYVASFLGYGMTSLRRFRIQVPIFFSVGLITLLSCYLLTEWYGLMGTAMGMLLGSLAQVLMSAAVVWRTIQMNSGTAASVGHVVLKASDPVL